MNERRIGLALVVAGIALALMSAAALALPGDGGTAATATPAAATARPAVATPTVAPTRTPTPPPTPTATTSPSPTVTPIAVDEAAVRAFVARLVEALRAGDVEFQVAHLHPATIERYGESQCRVELPRRADPTVEITIRAIGAPESWEYATDGATTIIEGAIPVDADVVVQGTTNRQALHLAAAADGTILWFTDCGVPGATPAP